MKILICGKGGCGKSSVTALLAIELAKKGYKVIVVDNDESNFGLHIQLGMELPKDFAVHFGGKRMVAEKLLESKGGEGERFSVFAEGIRASDILGDYMSKKGRINLLAIGKIRDFGEGCACPFNALSADLLRMLKLNEGELDQNKVVSVIPEDKRVFRNGLVGEALNFELKCVEELADFLESRGS